MKFSVKYRTLVGMPHHSIQNNGRTLNNMKRALDKCQNKCMEALNVYMLSPESMLLFSSSLIYVTRLTLGYFIIKGHGSC